MIIPFRTPPLRLWYPPPRLRKPDHDANATGEGSPSTSPGGYISMERMERSAISSTELGTIPRTTMTTAEADRASEKRKRGGRGTETSPSAGTMYM